MGLCRRRWVPGGVSALTAVVVVLAVAPPASAFDPVPNLPTQAYVAPDDLIGHQDPGLRQLRLDDFTGWILTRPETASSGYIAPIYDAAHLKMTVLWYGPVTAFKRRIAAEAARRGITLEFQSRKHSRAQTEAAARSVLETSGTGPWRGFHIDTVAGIMADYDGITVRAEPVAGFAAPAQALTDAARAASAQLGFDVRVVPGTPVGAANATRSDDWPAFNAGGYMRSRSDGSTCSSGFAIVVNGSSHTTTARHCTRNDYRAKDGTNTYGAGVANSPDGAARYLSQSGSAFMFDGAWNDPNGYKKIVTGFADIGIGGLVCTSGGNSGVHCGIKVYALSVLWNDGFGPISTIEAYQVDGGVANVQGDSGGPVLATAGPGLVHADGMIQAWVYQLSNCGSVHDPGICGNGVLFTSMRTIVNSISGASLRTG
jgi:hypothetical protein